MDWRARGDGACTEHDPDLWFATERSYDAEIAAAICVDECTVRETCLAHALERNERHGIWGGLNAQERQRLKRRGGTNFAAAVSSQLQAPTTTENRGERHERTGAGRPEDPQEP